MVTGPVEAGAAAAGAVVGAAGAAAGAAGWAGALVGGTAVGADVCCAHALARMASPVTALPIRNCRRVVQDLGMMNSFL